MRLIDRFSEHKESYRSANYNETQVRREFIDPLFKSLGWDVDNTKGYAEAYKEVIHEDAVRVSGRSKAPDYSFGVGGARKFFLEAKRPSLNLKTNPEPAFQLRRYGWSAKLPVSILTDFEEFSVYDCRLRPDKSDPPSKARVMYLTYEDYATRWDEIANVFGREAIPRGAFDKFAESTRSKRGTAEVDNAFLEEIEGWRTRLARSIARHNMSLSTRDVNAAVQRTIDRIVFLRICEDRGIEQYGTLRSLVGGENVYERLSLLFQRADDRYNSGLFHFQEESGRPNGLDTYTLDLTIDDRTLKGILGSLYYPDSPYEFSVLPADILGQVYERFLGKVIRLTPSHRAVVEDKPEVKKAGGVYYTPTYVVDYIVEETLGHLLQGKKLREVSGTGKTPPIRVVDPACGSGSFLLQAFQFLLDWHLEWYSSNDPERYARGREPRLVAGPTGDWRLTTNERKRILLTHIFGVDIDSQAVEVTKLSLLLKVLEGENRDTLNRQLELFQERVLPDLGNNIKCGNSLIAPDYYADTNVPLYDEDARLKTNAFSWTSEFSEALRDGGFDAIIGNPPYILLEDEFRDDLHIAYYRAHYDVASYKLDTYHLFMEKGLDLLSPRGRFSMITPSNFLTNNGLRRLRRHILTHSSVDHIVVMNERVFPTASVDTAIFVLYADDERPAAFTLFGGERSVDGIALSPAGTVKTEPALESDDVLFTGSANAEFGRIVDSILASSDELGSIAHVNFGKQLRPQKKYPDDIITVDSVESLERPYRPCYTGGDIGRYQLGWNGLACLDDEVARSGGTWSSERQDAKNKILTRQINRFPSFALDERGFQVLNRAYMINVHASGYSPWFVLGVLNSKIVREIWLARFYDRRSTYPKVKGSYLKKLPVPVISGEEDRVRADRISELAKAMHRLRGEAAGDPGAQSNDPAFRQLAGIDRELDRLVYEAFRLGPDEVSIIELLGEPDA